ncbi:hypothetical protein FACS1894172_19930 [Spirochaetia bacterium]|nr:hypothetical protein FACS1894164_19950 [Spirochaetia bacterium]GHU36821.1 hypothetical protein FACS1894172_19930 [Spirochaetia bacterium]
MRKFILTIVVTLIFSAAAFGQSRTNKELAVATDTGRILDNVTGWFQNEAGQWVSGKNKIPDRHDSYAGIDNFNTVKLYEISYKNIEYYMIEKNRSSLGSRTYNRLTGTYYYPTQSETHFYIIKKEDFIFHIKNNTAYENKLPTISLKVDTNWIENAKLTVSGPTPVLTWLSTELTPILENFEYYRESGNHFTPGKININRFYAANEFELLTFFYGEDSVVRFCFNTSETRYYDGKPLEDAYFECDYQQFINFFQPIIE